MNRTVTLVDDIARIGRADAPGLAAAEHDRMWALAASLDADDWSKPTDCTQWDVRALLGHVLGADETFSSWGNLLRTMRAARRTGKDLSLADAIAAVEVRQMSGLSTDELVARLRLAGPRSARFRSKVPSAVRAVRIKQVMLNGTVERWTIGLLVDVILTRDIWMHRVDVARATGRTMHLTPEHDGRIVADVVGDWAARHGRPFRLELDGPAGGVFATPDHDGDAVIAIDAVEFCRVVSGRGIGEGLLAEEVGF